jgi:hypothetical protein
MGVKIWLARLRRLVVVVGVFATVTFAALMVTGVSVDLGPAVRAVAEREGSKRIERPIRMGRLSVRLLRGQVVVEDLVIGGLSPTDRPFLSAKRIVVSLAWAPLLRREVFIESVEMTGWQMVVETWPGGRHSFPRLTPREPAAGPRPFVTTVQVVRAREGVFTFEDHGTPWSTVARNLDVTVVKAPDYRGEATFSNGTVKIQRYEPMWANMRARFAIDGGLVRFDRIDLETDGATTELTGEVDLPRWPEQTYRLRSHLRFPRMRELFFARDTFSLYGDGVFDGTFHLFKGGRDLNGSFTSEQAGVNSLRFSRLAGDLRWLPDRFTVTGATMGFSGGDVRFTYAMAPLGSPTPAHAVFDASWKDVDLEAFTDHFEVQGLRVVARGDGHTRLDWPLGRFADRSGEGALRVRAASGETLLGPGDVANLAAAAAVRPQEPQPFVARQPLRRLPMAGELIYRFGPGDLTLAPSWVSTTSTYIEFEGRTAYGDRTRLPFHVWSADWQESDRLLASIMTAFGARTNAVPVGGYGEFEGVLLESFRRPRVEGRFRGFDLRAFDVVWGATEAGVLIENAYADVTDAVVERGASRLFIEGRFALGYPRRDGGEEIDARIRVIERPLADLRHAFGLDDYRVDGAFSGEFHVYDRYRAPLGFGRMTITNAAAYGESFPFAAAGVRLEGEGVRIDAIQIQKSSGEITGAAYVGFDGTYSFNAGGRRIPIESLTLLAYPAARFSGFLDFSASGIGRFDEPRYDVKGSVSDGFVRDEGIGQIGGRVSVRGRLLTFEFDAASSRLAVSGSGRIPLTPGEGADIDLRFTETSLDPYVRAFEPRLSPFTTAVGTGRITVQGDLRDRNRLRVQALVERIQLTLFDYRLLNDEPVRLSVEQNRFTLASVRLVGDGTRLDLEGKADLGTERIAVRASGDANLGILQGFYRDLRASGAMALAAEIEGPLRNPRFIGQVSVTDGRLRHFSLPHSLEALNGTMSFDASGLQVNDVRARLGGGDVRFGGRIGLVGYAPRQLDLTATGQRMQLRYPEGVRSIIDAELALRGDLAAPLLTGTVTVRDAVWSRRFDAGTALFDLAGGGAASGAEPSATVEPVFPVRFDVRIVAPSTLRIQNNAARIVSSAELTLGGTYDRPVLFGRAEIERGEVLFEGNRYLVTRGSIDFTNPARIEPFFDIEAETRVRVPGETYRVVFRAAGTIERFVPELSSDPPLPTVDILALLFGDPRDPRNADIRALRTPDVAEQDLIRSRAARLLASPISAGVSRAVEETFGVDSVQITPSLSDPTSQQASRVNPTARLTIGKRVSERVYLTYSRALATSTRDQIILLEYDHSDRLAWIVSQNEDRTYALDVRVRHSF